MTLQTLKKHIKKEIELLPIAELEKQALIQELRLEMTYTIGLFLIKIRGLSSAKAKANF